MKYEYQMVTYESKEAAEEAVRNAILDDVCDFASNFHDWLNDSYTAADIFEMVTREPFMWEALYDDWMEQALDDEWTCAVHELEED